ncbi:ABC transporter substrate-binding protein [Desertihabitans aurantiacus]|uniref:ABC transporter substrate-binding protein n=1 Tax=Desertihabitans aurantiacus TaxID=2282477 RepID=UPI000DF76E7F|nr:extracellular solute-binding protein [Desertihabitans aurantiacus]
MTVPHPRPTPRPVRRALLAAVAALGLLVPAACSGGGEPEGPVTLRVSTWGNDSRLKLTEQAVDAFEAANPDVTVVVENSEWGSYWDKLATQTAGNNSPDVIQMDEAYIAAYGSRGALLDLAEVSEQLDLSAMDATVRDTGLVEEALVGAPIGVGNFSVAVNPDVLERAGVEMPDDTTWTWQDLAEISATVSEELGSEGVYGLDGFGSGAAELGAWTRQRGEEVWPTTGPGVSEATVRSFFDYSTGLVESGATPPAEVQVENANLPLDASMFATNRAAFHLLFHTQISAFGAASGTQLELLRLPAQAPGESPRMVNKASMYWSIASRTEHPEAAARLIDFLLTDPAATTVLTTERGIPAIPEVQEEISSLLDPQAQVSLDFTQAITPELVPPPQVTPAAASGFSDEFNLIGTDVLFGRATPADGTARVLSAVQSMA